MHGGLAEDREAGVSLQSTWHGTSTSPAAATAASIPAITTDPARREAAHNAGRGGAYTRSRRPVRLVHLEPAAGRGAALRRELAIKRLTRPEKERLVKERLVKPRPGAPGRAGRVPGLRPRRAGVPPPPRATQRRASGSSGNRAVYETEVREPLRALVEEMDVRLARLAPELVGDPRRSIFRIHRDVRFSADKSPYKTNAACQFYHHDAGRGAGQDAEGAGAGLYFQLADGECFVAGGIWMPARPALERSARRWRTIRRRSTRSCGRRRSGGGSGRWTRRRC